MQHSPQNMGDFQLFTTLLLNEYFLMSSLGLCLNILFLCPLVIDPSCSMNNPLLMLVIYTAHYLEDLRGTSGDP